MSERLPEYVIRALVKALSNAKRASTFGDLSNASIALEDAIKQYGDERYHQGYEQAASFVVPT